jgi:Na+/H+-translocating membrane pyrophosphatase
MENLLTNVSLWGILVVLVTSIRLNKWAGFKQNMGNIRTVASFWNIRLGLVMQNAYKPLTVFALSVFALFFCYHIFLDKYVAVWQRTMIAAAVSVSFGMFLKPKFYRVPEQIPNTWTQQIAMVLASAFHRKSNVANVGTLVLSLLGLLVVFESHQERYTWDVFSTLSVLASFALGASSVLLCVQCFSLSASTQQLKPVYREIDDLLKPDRLETLVGALVATMLLGAVLANKTFIAQSWLPAGSILLPVALTLSGICLSALTSILFRVRYWAQISRLYTTEKLLNALLMIAAAYFLVDFFLPYTWVMNGKEHRAIEMFYAVQAGIIGGLLLNKAIILYRLCRCKYYEYLSNTEKEESWLYIGLRFVFRSFCLVVPIMIVAGFFLFAYQYVGLYGIMLAMLAMLSNLTTHFTADEIKG